MHLCPLCFVRAICALCLNPSVGLIVLVSRGWNLEEWCKSLLMKECVHGNIVNARNPLRYPQRVGVKSTNTHHGKKMFLLCCKFLGSHRRGQIQMDVGKAIASSLENFLFSPNSYVFKVTYVSYSAEDISSLSVDFLVHCFSSTFNHPISLCVFSFNYFCLYVNMLFIPSSRFCAPKKSLFHSTYSHIPSSGRPQVILLGMWRGSPGMGLLPFRL